MSSRVKDSLFGLAVGAALGLLTRGNPTPDWTFYAAVAIIATAWIALTWERP